jgi:hypothetical protein
LAGRYANGGRLLFDEMAALCPRTATKMWTSDEDKQLLELQAAGKSNFLIAAELRRSTGAVFGRPICLKGQGKCSQ